jgi:hypothetical protein
MVRLVLALLLISATAFAAISKLYLKDGNYHLVREWKIDGDRVKFYSTERSDWEEVPLDLVDVRRTQAESDERKKDLDADAKTASDETAAVRAQRSEIRKIPQDAGVYTLDDKGNLTVFEVASTKMHTNKGRRVLQIATPIPLVTGKATVEIDQEHSSRVVHEERQEFFFQLEKEERFGLIKLTPHKGVRIAERLEILPLSKEVYEEVDEVPTFNKQLEGGLYKIWPEKPMTPGEYAIIEYTPGKVEPRIWDFQYQK